MQQLNEVQMSFRTRLGHQVAALALAAAASIPLQAGAQAGQTAWASGPWQYNAMIYGYLPTIGGSTTFPADSGGTGLDIDAGTIIDHLKMTFMGSLGMHNGRWGAFTDVLYLNLGANKSQTRDLAVGGIELPASATADLSYDMKGTIWTLAGQYRIAAKPDYTMDLVAGARMFQLKQRLDWSVSGDLGPIVLPGRSGQANLNDTVWDAVVGVKGRYAFGANKAWSLPYYLDVGAGESKSTWQGAIGIAYQYNWGEIGAMWRYIGYDFKSGGAVKEMNFNGPMIGANFRW
jgi:hypothetical protein